MGKPGSETLSRKVTVAIVANYSSRCWERRRGGLSHDGDSGDKAENAPLLSTVIYMYSVVVLLPINALWMGFHTIEPKRNGSMSTPTKRVRNKRGIRWRLQEDGIYGTPSEPEF